MLLTLNLTLCYRYNKLIIFQNLNFILRKFDVKNNLWSISHLIDTVLEKTRKYILFTSFSIKRLKLQAILASSREYSHWYFNSVNHSNVHLWFKFHSKNTLLQFLPLACYKFFLANAINCINKELGRQCIQNGQIRLSLCLIYNSNWNDIYIYIGMICIPQP